MMEGTFPVIGFLKLFEGEGGETVQRQWLLYSQSKDTLFCFPCLLFLFKDDKSAFSDVEKGFSDRKHLNPTLHNREVSTSHLQALWRLERTSNPIANWKYH